VRKEVHRHSAARRDFHDVVKIHDAEVLREAIFAQQRSAP